jgi:predicted DNA-binding transcriptional regulator AlpA
MRIKAISEPAREPQPQFLSAKQIAEMLGVEARSVCRWAQERLFPQPSIDRPRCKRWRRAIVEDWIRAQEKGR